MMLSAKDLEEKLDIRPTRDDHNQGITKISSDIVRDVFDRKGPPEFVVIASVNQPYWNCFTYVAWLDEVVKLSGFAWGYGGEGPAGLRDAFEMFGWDIDMSDLPDSNMIGAWRIMPDDDGSVHVFEVNL